MAKILIVGAGLSGAVLAQQLANNSDHQIVVVDQRSHTAGNCFTTRDASTGVMVHAYGPHIFNTSDDVVWEYIQRFGKFWPYVNRVKAITCRGVFSFPINLMTINQLFGKVFNPPEAEAFIREQGDASISAPANFEEQALKYLGRTIYETFFHGYTIKQWGCEPRELPASILKRLPVRYSYDDRYYSTKYQGIPIDGYTALVARILANSNIQVVLSRKYDPSWNAGFDYVFYSGALDAYFNFQLGRLGYRTCRFEREIFDGTDYQGNAVINYCEKAVPYTRVHEHAHFLPWEFHSKSIYLREFSNECGVDDEPFYPKRLASDMILLGKYRELGQKEEKVSFIGRLGTYRYLDMQHVVRESLDLARKFLCFRLPWEKFPSFQNVVP